MSHPDLIRKQIPRRCYGKDTKFDHKSKPAQIAKVHQKQSAIAPSYSDVLNLDNTVIMNFDIDKLEEESSKFHY
jgi:hypothetical protein